jgi:hypothetical protein
MSGEAPEPDPTLIFTSLDLQSAQSKHVILG